MKVHESGLEHFSTVLLISNVTFVNLNDRWVCEVFCFKSTRRIVRKHGRDKKAGRKKWHSQFASAAMTFIVCVFEIKHKQNEDALLSNAWACAGPRGMAERAVAGAAAAAPFLCR